MPDRFAHRILLPPLAALLLAATPARSAMPPAGGTLPAELADALRGGLFSPAPVSGGLPVTATPATWTIPVILVGYSDMALTYSGADFDLALFDTTGATATGSVHDYYRWASRGRLKVRGKVVATVPLPNDRFYYGFNSWGLNRISTPNNDAGLVRDAVHACDSQVRWSDYDANRDGYVDMVWVVHAGMGGEGSHDRNDLWSITSGLSTFWNSSGAYTTTELVPGSTTQHMRVDRFSILPELSFVVPGALSEIGVYCHEFGHALGLPDLYNTQDFGLVNSGPGNWCLMATGGYGGDGRSPEFPTHLGAWSSLFLGWEQAVRPSQDTTLVLAPIQDGGGVLDLSFQGDPTPDHFLVEHRARTGFDRNLPGEGLIATHVDEIVIGQGIQSNTVNAGFFPGLRIVEADGLQDLPLGRNRGDASDPFPGSLARTALIDVPTEPSTRTFGGTSTSLGLYGIVREEDGIRVSAQVRSPGWAPPVDRTEPGYEPVESQSAGNTAGSSDDGLVAVVRSEMRSGHAQVVLRTRHGNVWASAQVVSASPADALEPSLAVMPGGDLAIAWSDTRLGRATIWYRSRVRGVWTPERLLADLPGDSRSPAIAADPRGGVHVAWLFISGDRPRVQFLHFPYLSPYGQPIPVSGPLDSPGNPAVAAGPDGGSYILWPEGLTNPPVLRFARYHPDSGMSTPKPLAPTSTLAPIDLSAQVDDAGTLHTVWLAVGSGVQEIHYQRRPTITAPAPRDTVLESRGGAIQSVRFALDHSGGLHVVFAYDVTGAGPLRVAYKRRHPVRGWDAYSTEIATSGEGSWAIGAAPVPFAPGDVSILYTSFSGTPRFFERRRTNDRSPALDVPVVARPSAVRLAIGPNPARAGERVRLVAWGLPADTPVEAELFDVRGRRVARVPLAATGTRREGSIAPDRTADWPGGILFVRLSAGGRALAGATRLVWLR